MKAEQFIAETIARIALMIELKGLEEFLREPNNTNTMNIENHMVIGDPFPGYSTKKRHQGESLLKCDRCGIYTKEHNLHTATVGLENIKVCPDCCMDLMTCTHCGTLNDPNDGSETPEGWKCWNCQ